LSLAFGDLEPDLTNLEKARVVVYSVAFERTVTYGKGTAEGPRAILEASAQIELYDERSGRESCNVGIATLHNYEPEQWKIGSEAMVERVAEELEPLLRQGKWPVVLGGEHSVSVGAIRALAAVVPGLSVLQIDAHADLRSEYEGSRLNHACVMSRVLEICPYVGVGIRSLCREEAQRIERENIPIFAAHQLKKNRLWMEEVIGRLRENVYITFDVDGLDPSIMPATGTPEPGGLLWEETLEFLQLLFARRNVVGVDVVELAPTPGLHAADFLAARLVYKMIDFRFGKAGDSAGFESSPPDGRSGPGSKGENGAH